MPLTFSLQRLMIGITLFCIVCGFAVAFPQFVFNCMIFGLLWAPTIIVWIVLAKFSREPVNVWVVSLFGACAGLLLVPGVVWTARSGWHDFIPYFLVVAIPPAIGALVIGGLALIGDLLARRRGR